ncbi:SpoIVB peptidase [Pseudoflavonifractor phocaeensis]|uniref:SpoIVB peptidase n=1 Tax=Pseudoflavonifractor phocaeensis TaxID=1870988 RepID=UPI00195A3936|nr:SpoIVB peptidase [Pseudoflavonifractor phocaeensis]MBM6938091.1 SpoIVB peptidase [Pseudoflavonifractor phocaeensis]
MQEEGRTRPWVLTALRMLLLAAVLGVVLQGPWASAASAVKTVVPLGRAVGIKLFSDGVMVVGLSEVSTAAGSQAPARDCGLQEGDIITHINSTEVDTVEEVQSILQDLEGETMSIRAVRGEDQVQMTAQAVQCSADGAYKLGAWIRDSMAGIGTLTFYDPDTGAFGALGHGVSDVDTAQLMPLQSGSIMYATVSTVQKGAVGAPGQLQGDFQVNRDLGELWSNTSQGIFGSLTDETLTQGTPVEVARRDQVQVGKAQILSNIAGDRVETYEVEITHVYPEKEGDDREMMLKVTDPRLLETTGGIVQGMSGSPILQNGRIVGAVTHVLVNDPTQGYGILMETMLDAAEGTAT